MGAGPEAMEPGISVGSGAEVVRFEAWAAGASGSAWDEGAEMTDGADS